MARILIRFGCMRKLGKTKSGLFPFNAGGKGECEINPVSPGEMLLEEFLKAGGLNQCRLANKIGVPPQRIGEIIAGKRSITADTDLRLCRFFGLSDGWWLNLQAWYETELAHDAMKICWQPDGKTTRNKLFQLGFPYVQSEYQK